MIPRRSLDDESVVLALRAYQGALEAGETPDRAALLARFEDLADELAGCLDALDLMVRVAPHLQDETADDFDLQEAMALGDFRIRREVGRGGMGVVYEAEQMSLGRRVALKVLPFAAVLDSRYLQRFKNEAQAAAQLHHTSIVPVHAVGCERGVHYYAMQFIEGATLAGLIEDLRGLQGNGRNGDSSPPLELIARERTSESPRFCRAVAQLGIQAAEALDYAHESGVVHRDIKPPNLMVDEKGHLWITDFGLASTRTDSSLTATGDIVGTMRYMSPEQVLAKRIPIDHRTDIYSLGVTLYEFLTLEQAFPGEDPGAVMRDIALKEPVRPRALNRATPPELETILMKAMAKDAADRYATAQDFADDMRRFVEDRPIQARRPTLLKRAAQWARRHRPVVWAASAVLLLAVAGLVVGNVLLARERDEARNAQARADRNFRDIQELVDELLTRVGDDLHDEPHMKRLQKDFYERALEYHLRFLDRREGDPAVRTEAALAYVRVGDLYYDLGEPEKSEAAFEKAQTLYERAAREAPDEPRHRFWITVCMGGRGRSLHLRERLEEAADCYRRQRALLQALVAASPANLDARRLLANCCHDLGGCLEESRPEESLECFRQALRVREELVETSPTLYNRRDLAQSQYKLADRLLAGGDLDGAGEMFGRCLDAAIRLRVEAPSRLDLRMDEFHGWQGVATVAAAKRDWARAKEPYEKALTSIRGLAEEFPDSPFFAWEYARLLRKLVPVHRDQGHMDEALQAAREAERVLGPLTQRHPDIPSYRREEAHAEFSLACTLMDMPEKRQAAVDAFLKCVELFDELARVAAPTRLDVGTRGRAHYNVALILQHEGRDLARAEEHIRQCVEIAEKQARRSPEEPDVLDLLAASYSMQGRIWGQMGRQGDGVRQLEKALEIRTELAREHPAPQFRVNLAATEKDLAELFVGMGETKKGVELAGRAVEHDPDCGPYRFTLGVAHQMHGERHGRREHWTAAVAAYEEAFELGLRDPSLLANLTWLLTSCGVPEVMDAQKAGRYAPEFVKVWPHPVAWARLGEASRLAGDRKGEVEALRAAVSLEPRGAEDANDIAWILATGPVELRDAERAVSLAERAVKQVPENLNFLRVLGIARYRAGAWKAAAEAFRQSMAKGSVEIDRACDLIFLAMCQAKLGQTETARASLAEADALLAKHHVEIAVLSGFREEAGQLLGR